MRDYIIGTAGHIDHGKTTLIKALTGTNTDRLKEEQQRGITIDIGFAHIILGENRIGFVDVPGHEKFVKNMLAGIGGIQLVLLIVAADESVMPQTVEHFQICRLLEIPRGIIVITKKNSVEEEFLELVVEEIRTTIRGSLLETAPVVAVDSLTGEGLGELKKVLVSELEQLQKHQQKVENEVFRFPIDRVFSLQGFGTIVTGTPHSGSLEKGSRLAVYPSGKTGKVRSIEVFGSPEQVANAGQRTALNLTGFARKDLDRGMILGPPSVFAPSYMFDVFMSVIPEAPAPLKNRSPVRFHHHSGEVIGRAYLMEGSELLPGQSGLVQLRLESPTVACSFDHFVLRRYSPVTTVAGGIILDNQPSKLSKKTTSRKVPRLLKLRQLWEQQKTSAHKGLLEYIIWSKGELGVTLPELIARTGLEPLYLSEEVRGLNKIVVASADPLLAVSQQAFSGLKKKVINFLASHHAAEPLSAGVPQEEIKTRFLRTAPNVYFQALLDALARERQIEVSAGTLALHGRRISLTAEQEEVRNSILSRFRPGSLEPPSLEKLVDLLESPELTSKIYYYLLQSGELIRVTDNLVLSSEQISWLEDTVRANFPLGSDFGVADFKHLFGVSRKYAIPFLEFLDRRKVTRRLGNTRTVR